MPDKLIWYQTNIKNKFFNLIMSKWFLFKNLLSFIKHLQYIQISAGVGWKIIMLTNNTNFIIWTTNNLILKKRQRGRLEWNFPNESASSWWQARIQGGGGGGEGGHRPRGGIFLMWLRYAQNHSSSTSVPKPPLQRCFGRGFGNVTIENVSL